MASEIDKYFSDLVHITEKFDIIIFTIPLYHCYRDMNTTHSPKFEFYSNKSLTMTANQIRVVHYLSNQK